MYYQADVERGSLGNRGHHVSSRAVLFVRFQNFQVKQGAERKHTTWNMESSKHLVLKERAERDNRWCLLVPE